MKKVLIFATTVALLPSCVFAGYTVAPVQLNLSTEDKISSLVIKNDNKQTTNFQLLLCKKGSEKGKEVCSKTEDLTATPVMFKLGGGKSQLVRVMLKNSMYSNVKDVYRLMVKEVPHIIKKGGSHVQIISEFNVPITIKEKSE